jgi:polysaccharide biosynthesis/export protein
MRRPAALLLFLAAVAALSFGQAMDFTEPDETVGAAVIGAGGIDERLQLAVADPQYPVTPGDVYGLTFLQGIQTIYSELLVESDYTINMGILGKVDAKGTRFAVLKPQIEAIIAQAYPRSLPSVTIVSIGLFQVTLTGAIPQTQRVTAWGLSRLSELVSGVAGPYTSLRRVTVVSRLATRRSYDVFRAVDQGDPDQDPLLRPGDSVVFVRRGTVVGVQGQVYEPGSYEITTSEGLAELERFFQGFTPDADVNRLVVQRQSGDQVRQIPLGSVRDGDSFYFENGDVLIVPRRANPRSVVFVEGAVEISFDAQPQAAEQPISPVYNRITRELTVGDTLYSLLLDIQDRISPFAAMERGYIIRQEVANPVRINMREVLYQQSEFDDFVLLPFDRIVIPLDQPFVAVSGDVVLPDRYPYNPSADYAYYLGLAGTGAASVLEMRERVQVLDRDSQSVGLDTAIQPGFTIHVRPQEVRSVVVSGNVPNPGAYPYQTARDYGYYLRLAGVGGERLIPVRETVQVFDAEGTSVARTAAILPDYTVYVPLPVGVVAPDGTTGDGAAPILGYVLVTGAVNAPGLHPVTSQQPASHYLLQAGGVNREVSADGAFTVTDSSGEPRPIDFPIAAGDTIEVLRNGFVYNFNRFFPVITSVITFLTTMITLMAVLNQ